MDHFGDSSESISSNQKQMPVKRNKAKNMCAEKGVGCFFFYKFRWLVSYTLLKHLEANLFCYSFL